MSDIFNNSFVEVSIQDLCILLRLESMDNFVYDEHSIMRKHFVGLDNVVDMKQPAVMKSSNVDGNVEADKMFVDDHFQKLTNISDETGNVCNKACDFEELFGGLPNLTTSSIESAKNKDKGFDMEFGVSVGCPDQYMRHEMNQVSTSNICLVCV
ncbi:hypothetical protein Hanom_Chr14g01306871 [Helianthus anomalus]